MTLTINFVNGKTKVYNTNGKAVEKLGYLTFWTNTYSGYPQSHAIELSKIESYEIKERI